MGILPKRGDERGPLNKLTEISCDEAHFYLVIPGSVSFLADPNTDVTDQLTYSLSHPLPKIFEMEMLLNSQS